MCGRRRIATAKRQFILTWIQPGLAGLMDGTVSTLAPIFATAFATQDTWTTFLVGLAAAVGAGISMGFTEAVSDDGELSGRGSPIKRGLASGFMTAVGGWATLCPTSSRHFGTATALAIGIVFVELWAIAWIQNRFMEPRSGGCRCRWCSVGPWYLPRGYSSAASRLAFFSILEPALCRPFSTQPLSSTTRPAASHSHAARWSSLCPWLAARRRT